MSLFNSLGRKVEQFKHQVEEAASRTQECAECGEEFHVDGEACPACGAEVGDNSQSERG